MLFPVPPPTDDNDENAAEDELDDKDGTGSRRQTSSTMCRRVRLVDGAAKLVHRRRDVTISFML